MREMKDSGVDWIGEIPLEWDILPVKRFFRNVKRVAGSAVDEYERLSLTMNGVLKRSKEDSDGLQPEKFEGYQILQENELVFKLIDLENVKTSRVGLSPYTGLVSPAYIVLTNQQKDNRFFYYWFMFMYYNEVFNHLGGDGVRSALNAKDLTALPVPSISESTMKRIADYLDDKCSKIDAIIVRQQEVIEKLKSYKLSVITETVTKGLNPDVPMKDSGIAWIGEIPENWSVIISRFVIDKIGDIDHYMPNSIDSGIPYLMTGDLEEKASVIDYDSCKQISENDYIKLAGKMKPMIGDIIFARYATIGTVCYVDIAKDFLVSYSCVTIRPNSETLNGKYLYHYFKSIAFLEEIKKYINSNTQGNVGIESLYKTKLVIPSIKEQQEIASYLDEKCSQIDAIIVRKQLTIEKLAQYKKSLIYEVVTGKKEV